jgi:shikimate dehydrogenase
VAQVRAHARGLVVQPGFEMLFQQAHLYLQFFGFHEAAEAVKCDSRFIRECIDPGDIPWANPRPVVVASCGAARDNPPRTNPRRLNHAKTIRS